jgi:hypothetical protein
MSEDDLAIQREMIDGEAERISNGYHDEASLRAYIKPYIRRNGEK